jgi:hypothetical protein
MKLLTNLIGMAAAGTLGYMIEPNLRFELTGMEPSKTEIAANGRVVITMPGGKPDIDVSKLTAAELPLKIMVHSDVKVADVASGLNMTISAGSQVNLVRIEGGNALVSPGGTQAIGLIPIVETDLVEQIAARPTGLGTPKRVPAPIAAPDVTKGGDSQEPVAIPEAPPTPEPAPPPPAPQVPAPTPAPPVITPEPPPAVAPEPTPPAAPVAVKVDVVKVMQESIRAAQIKEFTFQQVLDWKAEADESVDGESYQTGLASYKAETIFGVKTIQAKALIKDGKVQRWIWPKSGMDIK